MMGQQAQSGTASAAFRLTGLARRSAGSAIATSAVTLLLALASDPTGCGRLDEAALSTKEGLGVLLLLVLTEDPAG